MPVNRLYIHFRRNLETIALLLFVLFILFGHIYGVRYVRTDLVSERVLVKSGIVEKL
jgi:hypothetical protein